MAFEVELEAPGNIIGNGLSKGEDTGDTRFQPMNRKWAPLTTSRDLTAVQKK
jgi:hypothetical protein